MINTKLKIAKWLLDFTRNTPNRQNNRHIMMVSLSYIQLKPDDIDKDNVAMMLIHLLECQQAFFLLNEK